MGRRKWCCCHTLNLLCIGVVEARVVVAVVALVAVVAVDVVDSSNFAVVVRLFVHSSNLLMLLEIGG